ncbi:MAG TPA: hypothetical protein VFZ75_12480 [Actinomycetota bacterium]|nr:hypothetical protein [Actinomycetota bacterium]
MRAFHTSDRHTALLQLLNGHVGKPTALGRHERLDGEHEVRVAETEGVVTASNHPDFRPGRLEILDDGAMSIACEHVTCWLMSRVTIIEG